ncbi:conserved hypothetical protein [Talaromyces marneffei ATCC 18224]|uniref:WW domain-containing protein n=1 Tax=Talaromyces marneffei (strain ATCC 18224 / CBS 334.59 / QM 7333) TaxID=441960 RepID=B6Q8H4_TALMQ|nr:conserved hypothetical protein [Talaromyces marneffei ATCC 18224]
MAAEEPQDSAGPSSPPPPLPEGWLAQWEGVSRKWYYVQRATGKSQWDIPTEPVILTPSTTPGSIGTGPTQAPRAGSQSLSPQALAAESPDLSASSRGFLSGHSSTTTRPSLSGVLGSVGNSAVSQIADRVIGRIPKDFIPGKHGSQSSSPGGLNNSGSHGAYGSGHNPLQNQTGHNSYGYASTGQSGVYTGNAPQYHAQGQATSQQTEFSQHVPAGPSAYSPQYHASNQPAPPNQFSHVNPGLQQPWPTQNSFPQNPHQAYQQPEPYGQPAGNIPSQPEWQSSAHPPIPHSTKPGSQPPQPNSHNPSAITNNPPQPNNNYQPPYYQQIPQHTNQQGINHYGPGQYAHHQQTLHGNPSIGGPMQPGQQPPQPYANNFQQHPSVPAPQQTSSYHANAGAPAPLPGISKFQTNSPISPINSGPPGNNFQQQPPPVQLLQHNNPTSPPNQYPPTNISNNPPAHHPPFAAELPDNQMMNMQNRPPSQQQYGQQQQAYSQPGLLPKPHQQPPPNSMGMDVGPGPMPMRHTPTDPSFVSGPWTSPPANANHHYPPNRYNNNPGGF